MKSVVLVFLFAIALAGKYCYQGRLNIGPRAKQYTRTPFYTTTVIKL